MKKVLLSLLSFLILTGCMKEDLSTREFSESQTMVKPVAMDVDKAVAEIQQIETKNRARLANTARAKRDCMKNIQVPRDFASIQEAVDNACEDAVIIVHAGTYTEVVVVNKPGIKLKANGEVTLVGGFVLNTGADNVDIQQFSIVIGQNNLYGIRAFNVTGGKIFQNTISDPVARVSVGVYYINSNKLNVKANNISGTGWGILFASSGANVGSHENIISNNYVTGIILASVIGFQGNCDHNFINENTLTNNPSRSNAGVMFYSLPEAICDNNIVKNNISNNGYLGIYLLGGTNNKIGPYNTMNNNTNHGFLISEAATGNSIFDNTMLGNVTCDLTNYALDPSANTFSNNIANCTIGL